MSDHKQRHELIEDAVFILHGEFPKGDEGDDWLYKFSSGKYVSGGADGVCPRPICAREEFIAASDRMRGKPDWSELPAKAEWLAQDRCGTWKPMQGRKPTIEEGSYWITDHHLQPQVRGTVLGDWSNTLEKRPEHIGDANEKVDPATAKPWFEVGELPKAGTKCLCYFDDGRECWHECVVVGSIDSELSNGYLAVSLIGKHERKLIWVNDFKPIKTDKEKAIEAADSAIHDYLAGAEIRTELLGVLYDAGLLRLPDQK